MMIMCSSVQIGMNLSEREEVRYCVLTAAATSIEHAHYRPPKGTMHVGSHFIHTKLGDTYH